jgi:hypothetical protein
MSDIDVQIQEAVKAERERIAGLLTEMGFCPPTTLICRRRGVKDGCVGCLVDYFTVAEKSQKKSEEVPEVKEGGEV